MPEYRLQPKTKELKIQANSIDITLEGYSFYVLDDQKVRAAGS
jgi:hypothetical protein